MDPYGHRCVNKCGVYKSGVQERKDMSQKYSVSLALKKTLLIIALVSVILSILFPVLWLYSIIKLSYEPTS